MVTTKLNLSMTEPQVRQIYAKQGDTGRVLDISLDQTPEDGTLRILRPDGVEVASEAVTGGEISESGETVTFESLTEADVTELTVGIEPVQDLNGYDAPWVGGAGKNLYNASAINTLSSNGVTATVSDGTITLNGTATANAFFSIHNTGYANQQYAYSFNNPVANRGVHVSFRDSNGNYFSDVSANTVNRVLTFTNEPSSLLLYVTSGTTLSNFVVKPQLELGYTATAWQPYSNICPITGHDEVTVTRTGKNLVNVNSSGITGAYIDANGEIHTSHTWSVSDFVPVMSGENYILSGLTSHPNTGVDNFILYDGNRNKVGNTTKSALTSFAIPSGVSYVKFSWKNTEKDTVMFEQGSTATAYEPYQGSTYTTSLGQTVYGGTLDLVSGVLTVDRAMVSLLGSDLNIGSSQTKELNMWRLSLNNPYGTLASPYPSGISNKYVMRNSYNGVNNNNGSLGLNQTSGSQILIRDDSLTTAQEVIDAFNSTPLTFVYPLASPQTYTLTAQQIKTLVGTNNAWASSGDIVSIKFSYGGLLSELPSDATSVVGKCYCDVEQNGVSSMPFTLNVKKNERES